MEQEIKLFKKRTFKIDKKRFNLVINRENLILVIKEQFIRILILLNIKQI